jgi:hypothetical protein
MCESHRCKFAAGHRCCSETFAGLGNLEPVSAPSNRVSKNKIWIFKNRDQRPAREFVEHPPEFQQVQPQKLRNVPLTRGNAASFFCGAHGPHRPHWLAEVAVRREPVSDPNSLLTGKIIANFSNLTLGATTGVPKLNPQISRLRPNFLRTEQGISWRLTGNAFGVAGKFIDFRLSDQRSVSGLRISRAPALPPSPAGHSRLLSNEFPTELLRKHFCLWSFSDM